MRDSKDTPAVLFQDVFVSSWKRLSRKNTPPVSKYIVPAALDPNWATQMPSQPIKSNACASRVTTTSVHGRAVREGTSRLPAFPRHDEAV